jgi:topoisomerase IA-like protein
MEIIIAIVVVLAIAGLIIRSRKNDTVEAEVPYKVETPVVEETPVPVVEPVKEVVSAGVPAAKKSRKPRAPKGEVAAKKTAAKKTAAKKTAKTTKSK